MAADMFGGVGEKHDVSKWFSPDDLEDPKDLPVPEGWRVLVRPMGVRRKSKGGLYLPDQTVDSQELMTFMGVVKGIGPLAWTREDMQEPLLDRNDTVVGRRYRPWASEGDTVFYGKYAGAKMIVGGVRYLLLNDDEILGIVPDPELLTVY